MVEAHDEAAPDVEADSSQPLHALHRVAVEVLPLPGLAERRDARRLDADEDDPESGRHHVSREPFLLGEIQGGLGEELECRSRARPPVDHRGQKLANRLLGSDEVVVHEHDPALEAGGPDRVELRQHLARRLGPWHPPVERDDVAELALERTAARELDREVVIGAGPEQVVAGDGRAMQLGLAVGLVHATRPAGLEVCGEVGEDLFRLAQHQVVGQGQAIGLGRGERSADHRAHAQPATAPQDLQQRVLLGEHAREQHEVGRRQVLVAERLHAQVDEPEVPVLGKQRRHGDERKGRHEPAPPHQRQHVSQAPVGLGVGRIDEQAAHGALGSG